MSQETNRPGGDRTPAARAGHPYSPVRLRRAFRPVGATRPAPVRATSTGVTGRSRLLAWSDALLARYGVAERGVSPAGAVLLSQAKGASTVIDRRSRHLYLSQTWAPRLALTLVSHSTTMPVGQAQAVSSPSTAGSGWRSVRPTGIRNQITPSRDPRPQMLAEAAATGMHHRLDTRATWLSLIAERELPETLRTPNARVSPPQSEAAISTLRRVAAAPVAAVYTRPSTPVAETAPAPPRLAFDEPRTNFGREPAAGRTVEADSAAIERISERVIQQIGHRIQAYRERTGRV